MSEMINNPATDASEEEKKKALLEAWHKFIEWLKYITTHTGKGGLIDRMEKMQAQIEESIAQSEINADTIDELCEVFKELNGNLDTMTPDKVTEVMDEAQKAVDDILGKNFIGVNKELTLEKKIEEIFNASFISYEKNLLNRIRIIDNDKTDNKLYVEADGYLFEATYIKDTKEVAVKPSSKAYEEVFKEDGSLQDGFEYVEEKTSNAEHDMMFAFAEKNGMKYAFDKEQALKDIEAQLPPRSLWLQSRMSSVKLSENGRYESHYFASENSFRIRDTETSELLEIKVQKGKIEIFASKNAKNLEDMHSPQKVGQWLDENGKIQGRFVFPSPNVAMMFHCDEMREWVEFNGISREKQKEFLHQDNDVQWSKVQEAHRNKVYDFKDALVERAEKEKDSEFSIRVSKKTDKHTFLTIIKQEGKGNHNPTISVAFDEQGNPKVLNRRTDDGKFSFMQNLRSHNVASDVYKLRSEQSFSQLYNVVTDVLKDMGIDSKCRFTKPMKAVSKSSPAPSNTVPFNERGINGREEQYGAEKMFADMANRVAIHALNTNSKIDRNTVYDLGIRNDADTILKELAKMNVLKKVGTRYERATTAEIYVKRINDLAKSPDERKPFVVNGHSESYTAFLIDAYQKYRDEEKKMVFDKLPRNEKENVSKILEAISRDNLTSVSTSQIQKTLRCEYNDAYKVENLLRQVGVLENGVITANENRITEMLENVQRSLETPESIENVIVEEPEKTTIEESKTSIIDILDESPLRVVEDYLEDMYSFPVDNIPSIVAELEEKGFENAENVVTSIREYMIDNEIINKDSNTVNTEKFPDGTFPEKMLTKIKNGEISLEETTKETVEKPKEKKQEGIEY